MPFTLVRTDGGETVQEACDRVGLSYTRGCGFYLLSKKEDIRCLAERLPR
jgi:hypothetical protein